MHGAMLSMLFWFRDIIIKVTYQAIKKKKHDNKWKISADYIYVSSIIDSIIKMRTQAYVAFTYINKNIIIFYLYSLIMVFKPL